MEIRSGRLNINMNELPENLKTLPNNSKLKFTCESCNQVYERQIRDIKTSIRNNKFRYVCKQCSNTKKGIYKNCTLCDTTFYVTNCNIAAKFCSSSCSAKYNNVQRAVQTPNTLPTQITHKTKLCVYCNKEFTRFPYLSKLQKYCSTECSAKHRKELQWLPIKEAIEKGETNIREGIDSNNFVFRKYLIEKYGSKCMRCNWAEVNTFSNKIPIELEHKDGICTNNNLSNLELLCPNCHSLTSTYKGANRPKGGSARYKVWKNHFSKPIMNI